MGCDKPSPRGGAGATALSSFDASSHWLDSVGPGTSWENTWRSGSVAGPKGKRKACNDKQVIYLKQIYPIGYCIITFIVHIPIYNACIISGGTLLVLNKKVGFSLSHPQVFLPQWPHKCRASETPRWKTMRFP